MSFNEFEKVALSRNVSSKLEGAPLDKLPAVFKKFRKQNLKMCPRLPLFHFLFRNKLHSHRVQVNMVRSFASLQLFSKPCETLKRSSTHEVPFAASRRFLSEGDRESPGEKNLMDFEPIVRFQPLLSLKNHIFANLIIRPNLDPDFTLRNFLRGAKQVWHLKHWR